MEAAEGDVAAVLRSILRLGGQHPGQQVSSISDFSGAKTGEIIEAALPAEVRAERGMGADAAAAVPSVRLITVTAMAAGMMAAITCMPVNSAGTVIPEKRKEESGAKSAEGAFYEHT